MLVVKTVMVSENLSREAPERNTDISPFKTMELTTAMQVTKYNDSE